MPLRVTSDLLGSIQRDNQMHKTPSTDSTFAIPRRPIRNLQGKVAIVTGVGSRADGIGNGCAYAILLAEAGVRVGTRIAIQADVSKSARCNKVVDKALEAFGRLNIPFNNVGIAGLPATAVEVDSEQWTKAMTASVTSMVLMTKRTRSTRLVGEEGHREHVECFCKGAVLSMTRAMAVHHAASGIRINSVCPDECVFPFDSCASKAFSDGMFEETREARRAGSLLKMEGNGWDAGLAVRFLASDEERWITGLCCLYTQAIPLLQEGQDPMLRLS
ncbi:short-chain dehydrogenase/reductase SDR [Coprinopsis sp. MPI-PUGE-AT-0042]|nr:short-chain dehydrogenase/reductase SDR [Coprinopsis sp. MPI-PUGE-AT-0042]